jgi:hypothetical protein
LFGDPFDHVMTVNVTYECPYCGVIHSVERDAYLEDKSVSKYPLREWDYADPSPIGGYEDANGIAIPCVTEDEEGCGLTFYLNFLQYEDGREVDAW